MDRGRILTCQSVDVLPRLSFLRVFVSQRLGSFLLTPPRRSSGERHGRKRGQYVFLCLLDFLTLSQISLYDIMFFVCLCIYESLSKQWIPIPAAAEN